MTRVTVSLPDEIAQRLKREARRRSTPVSEVVRCAVEGALGDKPAKKIGFAAVGASGRSDTSERIDQVLRDEWCPKPSPRRRARRR